MHINCALTNLTYKKLKNNKLIHYLFPLIKIFSIIKLKVVII